MISENKFIFVINKICVLNLKVIIIQRCNVFKYNIYLLEYN